ncbi:MAG: FAD/NAD(P)-binding protein [Pseudomonadota bacterium]|nr:FAD/NAD(P)-binding protein [Pseudomonadota bacterium]
MTGTTRRIAIIGFGPRGLGALEALVRCARRSCASFSVDIFDPEAWPAAGPNFSPDEPEVCLLNLPLRIIDLPPPTGQGIADFPEWAGAEGEEPEAYLPRARLGAYLNARFSSLLASLPAGVTVSLDQRRIDAATRKDGAWRLESETAYFGPYDDVLLSLGQPQTRRDEQMVSWETHAGKHRLDILPAYPGRAVVEAASGWQGKVVAIRGLGLSAIDVVRMLTIGLGGRFQDGSYVPSGREPGTIAPFSLDGHAPAPKPETAAIDARFEPSKGECEAFRAALVAALSSDADEPLAVLTDALIAPARRILTETGAFRRADEVENWLVAERKEPGSQEARSTVEAIKGNIAEAEGRVAPSPGYVIGQLWRKWQPLLREIYDSAQAAAETAEAIVKFDEGLKRYSYGAPVDTLYQLLALIDVGLVYPCATADPDITLSPQGWRLQSEGRSVVAQVMVDSVLPPPVLEMVSEPLLTGLREQNMLSPLKGGLGVRCAPDGAVIREDGERMPGLWLAGRLASGCTIANDSIHDCFAETVDRWSLAVFKA